MKYCKDCKYAKDLWFGSVWCQGPHNKLKDYVSGKPEYRPIRCYNERTKGACGPEARYYEPRLSTRVREFFLGAKPQ